jgi:hypothetical protein
MGAATVAVSIAQTTAMGKASVRNVRIDRQALDLVRAFIHGFKILMVAGIAGSFLTAT